MSLTDDLKDFRQENREDHKGLADRLDRLNGQVHANSGAIIQIREIQNGHDKRLEHVEREHGSIWKVLHRLDRGVAVKWGYAAGAAATVLVLLQYVILPLVKHIFVGG